MSTKQGNFLLELAEKDKSHDLLFQNKLLLLAEKGIMPTDINQTKISLILFLFLVHAYQPEEHVIQAAKQALFHLLDTKSEVLDQDDISQGAEKLFMELAEKDKSHDPLFQNIEKDTKNSILTRFNFWFSLKLHRKLVIFPFPK